MRLKILNGAPLSATLAFDEDTLLDVDACCESLFVPNGSSQLSLSWRFIAPKNARLGTGWSQPDLPLDATIPTPVNDKFVGTATQPDTTLSLERSMADDFLQHSIMIHDTLLSSQVIQDPDETISSSSFLTTSFATTSSEISLVNETCGNISVLQIPPKTIITILNSLPDARTLRSIYPQTPTPNFVCVLVNEPEYREVIVRKTGRKVNLCEILVADDTRSAFKVTFWLHPPRQSNKDHVNNQLNLLQTLETLQVGDVLLLRNIALTSFRDEVYGQSLNPGIARARTSIDILIKGNGAAAQPLGGLPAPVMDALIRIKRWARIHVAMHDVGSKKRKAAAAKQSGHGKKRNTGLEPDESLPPDTLEAI